MRALLAVLLMTTAAWGGAPRFTFLAPTAPPPARRSGDAALRTLSGLTGTTETMFVYGGFSGATLNDLPQYSPLTNSWTS